MAASTRILLVILASALAIRLAAAFAVSEASLLSTDGDDYRDIAGNLVSGHGYSISYYRWFEPVPPDPPARHVELYRPPFLPLLGALYYKLPGNWVFHARVGAAVMGVLAVLAVYLVARRLFGTTAGLVAAGLFTLDPHAVWYSGKWSTEHPSLALLWLGVFLLLVPRAGAGRALLLGAVLGLSTLVRPNMLAFGALFALLAWRRWGFRPAVLAVCGMALVLAPWAVRNARVTGVPSPTTFFAPYNMWLGMNDAIYEMYRHVGNPEFKRQGELVYDEQSAGRVRRMEAEGIHGFREANRFWTHEYTDYIRSHPDRAAFILGHRVAHYFQPWPMTATATRAEVLASTLFLLPLMALAVVAVFRCPPAREPVLAWVLVVSVLTNLLFLFSLRYRFPVFDPLVAILAAGALARLAGEWRARRSLRSGRHAGPPGAHMSPGA